MTNHERIKQMTAEQLAAFIADNQYGCTIPQSCVGRDCKDCITIWLNSEAD